ncbi:MAG: hypothetical protein ACLPKB_12640 [Xanthobacteraceae bacterium]
MSSFASSLFPVWSHHARDAAQSFRRQLPARHSRVAADLMIVCLWAIVGLVLTALAVNLGAELGQILAAAG